MYVDMWMPSLDADKRGLYMRNREEGTLCQPSTGVPDMADSQSFLRRFLDFVVIIIIDNSFAGTPLKKERSKRGSKADQRNKP